VVDVRRVDPQTVADGGRDAASVDEREGAPAAVGEHDVEAVDRPADVVGDEAGALPGPGRRHPAADQRVDQGRLPRRDGAGQHQPGRRRGPVGDRVERVGHGEPDPRSERAAGPHHLVAPRAHDLEA